jgi:hypothetical protein
LEGIFLWSNVMLKTYMSYTIIFHFFAFVFIERHLFPVMAQGKTCWSRMVFHSCFCVFRTIVYCEVLTKKSKSLGIEAISYRFHYMDYVTYNSIKLIPYLHLAS